MLHTGTYLLICDQELREFHATWLKREKEQRDAAGIQESKEGEEKCTMAAEVSAEVETPVTFFFQNIPAPTIDINLPSSITRSIEPPSTFQDVESSSKTRVSIPAAAAFSPTLCISTLSGSTPTEFGEEIEQSEGQATVHHDTFYFEDGNVEIVCGDTVFRVHSTIISFTPSKLQDILSPPTPLHAPMPEGLPRIAVSDIAEDFAVLLKAIYTPGWVSPSLEVSSAG